MYKIRQYILRLKYALHIAGLVFHRYDMQTILSELQEYYPVCEMLKFYDKHTRMAVGIETHQTLKPYVVTVTFRME